MVIRCDLLFSKYLFSYSLKMNLPTICKKKYDTEIDKSNNIMGYGAKKFKNNVD